MFWEKKVVCDQCNGKVKVSIALYYRSATLCSTACRDAWDGILLHQLDYRYRPCNFVEIMPRLDEHLRRAKAR